MHRLVAIVGTSALTLVGAMAWAQTAPSPDVSGQRVYAQSCGGCHNGGDETAPPIERIGSFGAERISKAIHAGGVMATQASALTEAQRTEVIAFLTATPERRAQLSTPNPAAAPIDSAVAARFKYPTRRERAERDTATKAPSAPAWPAPKLGDGPFASESWEQRKLRTVVVARGLSSPRALQFLPNGDLLVAERTGRIRVLHDGKLDPTPVGGVPKVAVLGTATGFMGIALHPDFANNGLIYLAYHKAAYADGLGVNVVYRGRWTGKDIVDGKEIFVSDDVDALYSKMVFGPDGKLYVTIGCPGLGTDASVMRAQHGDDYAGKTLRLNDDGSIPADNPFVKKRGYHPAIFTLGHRVDLGMAVNPKTGELWVAEHGPNGGDELNILKSGQNYGWPIQGEGRYYGGQKIPRPDSYKGLTMPQMAFVPSIAPGDLVFYTGDKFPAWKGNLFVGSMRLSEAPHTGNLMRLVLNENGGLVRSEMLLADLHQRIRNVAQGPDGSLWVTTDEGADSVLMRIEPGG